VAGVDGYGSVDLWQYGIRGVGEWDKGGRRFSGVMSAWDGLRSGGGVGHT
jgi:hypothetical protein